MRRLFYFLTIDLMTMTSCIGGCALEVIRRI